MEYQRNAAEILAQKATIAASSGAIFLGLTANETAALGGLIIAGIVGLSNICVSIYFKLQHLKLLKEKLDRTPFPSIAEGVDQ